MQETFIALKSHYIVNQKWSETEGKKLCLYAEAIGNAKNDSGFILTEIDQKTSIAFALVWRQR